MEQVKQRLLRATSALDKAGVAYAVIGGNAVATWVGHVDPSLVRQTRDVDVLVRRADFDAVKAALEGVGFVYRHAASLDMFLDGPGARARDAVHLIFSGEKVKTTDAVAAPDVTESAVATGFRVINLDALVRMKLTSFRDKDRTHLRDMMDAGLIDATWPARLPPELAARLQELLDNPEG